MTAHATDSGAEVRVEGEYAEAKGFYEITFATTGMISMRYRFTVTNKGRCDPRQIGLVFTLPGDCQTLSWRRKAYWTGYPDDHIGRPRGSAAAFVKSASFRLGRPAGLNRAGVGAKTPTDMARTISARRR